MYAHHYHHPFVLKKVHQYCKMYKLSVNMAKTIFFVFSRGKMWYKVSFFQVPLHIDLPTFQIK